jgi:hypothetical protein
VRSRQGADQLRKILAEPLDRQFLLVIPAQSADSDRLP